MDAVIYLLAMIGALCLAFAAMAAFVHGFERPNRITRKAPMMREEYRK